MDGEVPGDAPLAARLQGAVVGALVKMSSLHRKPVLRPHPLDMDERALPLAEEQMLESGDREELVLGKRAACGHSSCSGASR
jgi:hypothetical protein